MWTSLPPRFIDLDFPPIVEADLKSLSAALSTAKDTGLISDELAATLFMLGANVNNIEEELEKLEQEKVEKASKGKAVPGEPAPAPIKPEPIPVPLKEAIDTPDKSQGERFAKKNNYMEQRMNGYRKSLAGNFRTLQQKIKWGLLAEGIPNSEKFSVRVEGLNKTLKEFGEGMKASASKYFPEAISIGKAYLQKHLKEFEVGLMETLYEAEGRESVLLQEKLGWNEHYVEASLVPDIRDKISEATTAEYKTAQLAKGAVNQKVNAFESRVEQYVGAFWSVEEAAVKEAGFGTGLQVNFAGADDGGTCAGCAGALAGNPYPIDSAPLPGDFECNGRCRHALQILPLVR